MTFFKLSSLKRSLSEIEETCCKRIKSGEMQRSRTEPEDIEITENDILQPSKAKRKAEEPLVSSKRPKLDFVVEKLKSLALTDPKENKLQLVHVKPIMINISPMVFSSLQVEDVTEEWNSEMEKKELMQVVKYQKPIYQ